MNEMMSSGVELMFVGMGIVFAFLAMLVVMVKLMAAAVQRFFPEDALPSVSAVTSSTSHTDAGLIAAISAALHQYRNKHK